VFISFRTIGSIYSPGYGSKLSKVALNKNSWGASRVKSKVGSGGFCANYSSSALNNAQSWEGEELFSILLRRNTIMGVHIYNLSSRGRDYTPVEYHEYVSYPCI
jgi:hypothetical protein